MKSFLTRAVASTLIFNLTYLPILGGINNTTAAAQTVQNTTWSYLYDAAGNLSQTTDPLGRATNLSYDALSRLKQTLQPAPITGATRPATTYTYDGLDQISSVTDPRSLVTNYTVDGYSNQTALASPDTGLSAQNYDLAGNLTSNTDARGKTTTYAYDVLNRVISISYASGTATTFEYDGGASGAPNAIGRLTKMADESGQTRYSYDQRGRLLEKIQTINGPSAPVIQHISYTYDGNGHLSSLTYPSGNRINYSYDAAGNINKLMLNTANASGGTNTDAATVLLDQINYAPFGPVKSWAWGNSSDTSPNIYTRTFDLDGRIISYPLGNTTASASALTRTLTYDAASRITQMNHTGDASATNYNQTFAYNGLDQLTNFLSKNTNQSFAYDANGNRSQATFGANNYSNTISPSSNRLLATSGPFPARSNSFDAAGNLINDGTIKYVYSDRGRLQSTVNAGLVTSYWYNGNDERVRKTSALAPTGTNFYAYDEQGQLLGEYDANGLMLQETVYLGSMPVSILKRSTAATDSQSLIYYVYTDHINTPRLITAAADNSVVWRWDNADPFGISQPDDNLGGSGIFTYNVRFSGQIYDKETNNHYNHYRYYDSQLGKYLESDPTGLNGGINTYEYANSNPTIFVDPTGEIAFLAPAIPYIVEGAALGWRAYQTYQAMNTLASVIKAANTQTQTNSCSDQNGKDPCEEIRKKIKDTKAQLSKREKQLSEDQYNLFNRAYLVNPGGDLSGKGTYTGHVDMINSVKRGLEKMEAQAKAMGCL
ncbi:RHS repeat-associated core domain-containing protein [Janthinobacterium agaricidamnosum]|uniref:RHS Repeat family protein n=1 Tax=Janthinobacterium agaricidamnosum NBRC 102515 = DSM 9628 TaxID=1349767 RepID=W0V0M5_9BURK|nr:RHS repeat-associated core domain-containing protein [Janthinobacterium agaricidamnosum]CDG81421.1 RHS Repeat family protein [Janthinobacterium agaricidamnosum NBRC 102515 = DSM 9628]